MFAKIGRIGNCQWGGHSCLPSRPLLISRKSAESATTLRVYNTKLRRKRRKLSRHFSSIQVTSPHHHRENRPNRQLISAATSATPTTCGIHALPPMLRPWMAQRSSA
ncbi:MAG: hypothetical protein OJF49_000673 [Ktedonobacterales bacterium]|nr:MAG: hypothetical protein OJF49_000673 [Ktedonobacterales bacterium]